jgi:hypothetical protein
MYKDTEEAPLAEIARDCNGNPQAGIPSVSNWLRDLFYWASFL